MGITFFDGITSINGVGSSGISGIGISGSIFCYTAFSPTFDYSGYGITPFTTFSGKTVSATANSASKYAFLGSPSTFTGKYAEIGIGDAGVFSASDYIYLGFWSLPATSVRAKILNNAGTYELYATTSADGDGTAVTLAAAPADGDTLGVWTDGTTVFAVAVISGVEYIATQTNSVTDAGTFYVGLHSTVGDGTSPAGDISYTLHSDRSEFVYPYIPANVKDLCGNNYSYAGTGLFVDFSDGSYAMPANLTALGATYTRNSTDIQWRNGELHEAAANEFGRIYDSNTGKNAYFPRLAATNSALYNQDMTNAYWNKGNCTAATAGAVSGLTGKSYTRLTATSTTNPRMERSFSIVGANAAWTLTAVVKTGTNKYASISHYNGASVSGAVFDVDLGTVVTTSGAHYVNSGIYKIDSTTAVVWVTSNLTTLDSSSFIQLRQTNGVNVSTGSGIGDYVDYFGATWCAGYVPYIILTTGSTASRSADVLSVPTSAISGFSSAGYALYADAKQPQSALSGGQGALVISDNSSNNYAGIFSSAADNVFYNVVSGAATQASNTPSSKLLTTERKMMASCKANQFYFDTDGSSANSDLAGSVPVSPTILYIGASQTGGIPFSGHIYEAGFFTSDQTQNQIANITVAGLFA